MVQTLFGQEVFAVGPQSYRWEDIILAANCWAPKPVNWLDP